MKFWIARLFATLCVIVLGVACSSSSDAPGSAGTGSGGTSSGGTGGSSPGGSGGGVSGAGGSGGSSVQPVTLADFPSAVAAAICGSLDACCKKSGLSLDKSCQGKLSAEVSNKHFFTPFDEQLAGECVAGLKEAAQKCDVTHERQSAIRASCSALEAKCAGSQLVEKGAACDLSEFVSSGSESGCNTAAKICREPAACNPDSKTCCDKAAIGGKCFDALTCVATEAYCADGICAVLPMEGEDCLVSGPNVAQDCSSGLACIGMTCQPYTPPGQGEACIWTLPCQVGLCCMGDKTCQPCKTTGQDCTQSMYGSECTGQCVQQKCQPAVQGLTDFLNMPLCIGADAG